MIPFFYSLISWGTDSSHLHFGFPYADEVADIPESSLLFTSPPYLAAASLKPAQLNYELPSWSSDILLIYKLPLRRFHRKNTDACNSRTSRHSLGSLF